MRTTPSSEATTPPGDPRSRDRLRGWLAATSGVAGLLTIIGLVVWHRANQVLRVT